MPNWRNILSEIQVAGSTHDVIRRKYLQNLHEVTGRNVIVYYSGWLQKPEFARRGGMEINDADKNGFMAAIHEVDRTKGLDLLLHTPGGDAAATESLVDYLRSMFETDIRAVVPQIALSAGTMVALACKEIVMGKHSSLGPVDPQIAGVPAHGIIEEFRRALQEVAANPACIPLWQPIIAKYSPTLIGECEKAIEWSNQMVEEWLLSGMFADEKEKDPKDAKGKVERIIETLGDHALTKSHARHISLKQARDAGIKVVALEDDDDLQEAVLTVHHACIQTLSGTGATKIIENHKGVAYMQVVQQQIIAAGPGMATPSP